MMALDHQARRWQWLVLLTGLAAFAVLSALCLRHLTAMSGLGVSLPTPVAPAPLPGDLPVLEMRLADRLAGRHIEFETGRAVLMPAGRALLDSVAPLLLADSAGRIEVAGHTDMVVDYLVAWGVAARRLLPRGYGATRPLSNGSSPLDDQRNPRIEFHLLPGD